MYTIEDMRKCDDEYEIDNLIKCTVIYNYIHLNCQLPSKEWVGAIFKKTEFSRLRKNDVVSNSIEDINLYIHEVFISIWLHILYHVSFIQNQIMGLQSSEEWPVLCSADRDIISENKIIVLTPNIAIFPTFIVIIPTALPLVEIRAVSTLHKQT